MFNAQIKLWLFWSRLWLWTTFWDRVQCLTDMDLWVRNKVELNWVSLVAACLAQRNMWQIIFSLPISVIMPCLFQVWPNNIAKLVYREVYYESLTTGNCLVCCHYIFSFPPRECDLFVSSNSRGLTSRSSKDTNSKIMVFEEKMIMNGEPEDVSSFYRYKTTLLCQLHLLMLDSKLTEHG